VECSRSRARMGQHVNEHRHPRRPVIPDVHPAAEVVSEPIPFNEGSTSSTNGESGPFPPATHQRTGERLIAERDITVLTADPRQVPSWVSPPSAEPMRAMLLLRGGVGRRPVAGAALVRDFPPDQAISYALTRALTFVVTGVRALSRALRRMVESCRSIQPGNTVAVANASAAIHPSSPPAVPNVNPPVNDAASSMSALSSPATRTAILTAFRS